VTTAALSGESVTIVVGAAAFSDAPGVLDGIKPSGSIEPNRLRNFVK